MNVEGEVKVNERERERETYATISGHKCERKKHTHLYMNINVDGGIEVEDQVT